MRLVLTYIEAAQRARASGDADDFEALREFLAPDVLIRQRARGRTNRGG
jgi:hypothetical protein